MTDDAAKVQPEGETTMKRAATELKKARAKSKQKQDKPAEPSEAVRRAAVLHGMGYQQFLEMHSEEDAVEIVKNKGCSIKHGS